MNEYTVTMLKSIIENNQDMLDYQDLTKDEEKECINEINKCKKLLKKMEEDNE